MLTMTSLAAQSQFGNLIDCSIPYNIAMLISERYPLRGQAAADSMRSHLDTISNQAAEDGLTEIDVIRMLNAD